MVDLTPAKTSPFELEESSGPNSSVLGGVLGAFLLLGAIVWLAISLFTGGDSNDDTATDDPTDTAATDTATDPNTDGTDDGRNIISVFDMRQGDCIVGDIAGQLTEVEKVDCDQEHNFQVYREALVDNSITEFDESAITSFAEDLCRATLVETVPDDDDRGISFKILQPTIDSWNDSGNPDRLVTCLLFDEDALLVGRVG